MIELFLLKNLFNNKYFFSNIVDESSISALYDNIAAVAASVANSSEENHIIDYKKNCNGFTNGCSTRKSPARSDFWNGLMKKANSKTGNYYLKLKLFFRH